MPRNFPARFTDLIVKNSKKIIVIWIIAVILLAPFSYFFFTDTSYNVAKSIITKSSMAYKENITNGKEFNSSKSPGLIIVLNQTSLNNLSSNIKIKNYINSVLEYLKNNSFKNVSINDIYTIEKPLLLNYSDKIRYEENLTYKLLYNVNKKVISFYNNITGATGIKFSNRNNILSIIAENFIATQLDKNSTVKNFIDNVIHTSALTIAKDAYNAGSKNISSNLDNYTVNILYSSSKINLSNSPVLKINYGYKNYLNGLIKTDNTTSFSLKILKNKPYNKYPVVPSKYISDHFLNSNNTTSIIFISYGGKLTKNDVNSLNTISKNDFSAKKYYLTGTVIEDYQLSKETVSGSIIAVLIGIIISIIIVGLFFKSIISAFLPVSIFFTSAIVTTGINGILYEYIFRTRVSFITPTLVIVLILGISSDYSVYLLSRYKREKINKNEKPIENSIRWAGHAIFISGTTLALSYIVLWLSNVPLFSEDGLANAIGAIITIIAVNTLLVSIISVRGKKIFYPDRLKNKKFLFEGKLRATGNYVINNRKKILVIFIIITFLSLYLYSNTPTNLDVFKLVPQSSSFKAIEVTNKSVGYDLFDPVTVILNLKSPLYHNNTVNKTEYNYVSGVEKNLTNKNYVKMVCGPGYPYGKYISYNNLYSNNFKSEYLNKTLSYLGHSKNYVKIKIYLSNIAWGSKSSYYISHLKIHKSKYLNSYSVGGLTEYLDNSYSYISNSFYKILPVLTLSIFVLLFIQLYSAFTPLRLILMVLSSIIVSLSISFVILYYILKLNIIIFMPLFVFITLLAIGLDYDIFMVTRAKEEIIKGNNSNDAIKNTIKENGGIIMVLGSLLFFTFISLVFSGIGIIQEMGIGLAMGVLIDTFVSWFFFVPVIMSYLSRYNWWPSKL